MLGRNLGKMLKKIQADFYTPPQTGPIVAHESSQICYKITRDFSKSGRCILGTQWMQTNYRGFSIYSTWCPWCTAVSSNDLRQLKPRLNYGKDMNHRACCYVTSNCQSKLSVHAHLDEYIITLPGELCISSLQHQCLSWLGPPLPWGVCSVLSLINLFLPRVRLQILLCVFTKTHKGHPCGGLLSDSSSTQ